MIVAALLLGCAPLRVQQLEAELARVTVERDALAAQLLAAQTEGSAAQGLTPAEEAAAKALYDTAIDAFALLDIATARASLDELDARWPQSRAARSSGLRLRAEINLVDKVPPPVAAAPWYTHPPDPTARVQVIVFFESWCPHCANEAPHLQDVAQRYRGRGVEVIGLTWITRSATEDSVRAFIAEHGVTYPVGKEDGSLSDAFEVSGIPAAALVRDGRILWRGHPARITDAMLEKALQ